MFDSDISAISWLLGFAPVAEAGTQAFVAKTLYAETGLDGLR